MTNHYDTIIVGAGLAGLTAAARLAESGLHPLLIERNSEIGGRARSDELDGFVFNQGGHALYQSGVGRAILQKLGIEPQGEAPPLAGAQLLAGGAPTPMPAGPVGLARTKALSRRGKLQFATLMARLGRLKLEDYADISVDDWLRTYQPDVQAVGKAFVRLSNYVADTDVMSADAAISQLRDSLDGVLYLHNGWGALCAEIAQTATVNGATTLNGVAVTSVDRTDDGFVVGAGDQRYSAPSIVLAAGGAELTARLLGIERATIGRTGRAPEAAVLDMCLDSMPTKHRFVLGVDEPTYFSVHSPPALPRPEGKVAAVAMRYIANDDTGSADEHRESLERICAVAGVDVPTRSRFLRRMTVTNGLPLAAEGGMRGRPSIKVPNMPGAFIAGDWVGSRGLLADAAIASGFDAAEAVVARGPALAKALPHA